MSDNTKIGFIGFGNMAQAIADGLLSKNAAAAENIFACAANWEKLCRNTKTRDCSMQGRSRNSGKFGYRYPGRQALYDG